MGQEPLRITAIPAGLGLRRFWRVLLAEPPHSVIALISADEDPAGRPAGVAAEPPLEPIRGLLERSGLPVPRGFGATPDGDVALIEDGGSETLAELARADPERAERILQRVADDVVRLQAIEDPGGVQAYARRLDAPLFAYKAELFSTWSLPVVLAREASHSERAAVARAFAHVAESCARAPRHLAHRDLQSHNLLVRGDEAMWIDLQGALLAPPEYDFVCLLRDSYVEWPEPVVDAVLARVRPKLPDAPPPADFAHRFALLTLTRKGKDHARFLYVARTRGDRSALAHLPATVRQLKRAAETLAGSHPDLGPLTDWIAALPEEVPM